MMNGSKHVNVRSVQRRRVRIVQHVDIAFLNLAFEAPDNSPAGLGGTSQMMKKTYAAHKQRAIGAIQADHQVVAFVGNGRARYVLERDNSLFDDPEQAVANDGIGNWIHA